MLRYLIDIPNIITVSGLLIIVIALWLILDDHISYAVILLMWAVILDHLDGLVARRSLNRRVEYANFGGDLDSLTDFVSAAVAPWLILMHVFNNGISLVVGIVLFVTAALRVAYFNNYGLLPSGKFYGLPLTYNVPCVGFIFSLQRFAPSFQAVRILPWLLITLAVLHVFPIHPPPVRGWGYVVVVVYAVALTIAMLV